MKKFMFSLFDRVQHTAKIFFPIGASWSRNCIEPSLLKEYLDEFNGETNQDECKTI